MKFFRLAITIYLIALLVWAVGLAVSLPSTYEVVRWKPLWVGFDIFLALSIIVTLVQSYKKSRFFPLTAGATAALFFADSWFDTMTSHSGTDLRQALFLAFIVQIPLGILTFVTAYRSLASQNEVR